MTSHTQQPKKKRSAFVVGGATILSFVALLYVVEAFDQLNGNRLDENGIRPLETDGLGEFCSRRCWMRAGRTWRPTPGRH